MTTKIDERDALRRLDAAVPAIGVITNARTLPNIKPALLMYVQERCLAQDHDALDVLFETTTLWFMRGTPAVRNAAVAFLHALHEHSDIQPADYVWKISAKEYALLRLHEVTASEAAIRDES